MRYARISFNLEKPGRTRPPATSALPCLITFLCPVDDVYSALAPHQLVGAVALAQGFQRVADFHGTGSQKTTGPRSRLETKLRPMPHSQAAINLKNKCPERSLPRPRRLPRCQDRHARRTRRRRRGVPVRRLSLFVVAKSPSPGKDHALGRRTRGTALHSLVAAGRAAPSQTR